MCFSAEADLVAGVVVSAIGVHACAHLRRRTELLVASIPLVLGAHQLIETFVWWGLDGELVESVWRSALLLWLTVAFGVLPVLVPLAVGELEPTPNRARTRVFVGIGAAVAATLMYSVVRGPIDATVEGHHIAYHVDLWHGWILVTLYVLATCGSLLASHHRHVRGFGVINLAAVGLLVWLDRDALVSLWCAWAAVSSLAISIHLRRTDGDRPQLQIV